MNKENLADLLLQWYAKHGRDLPWRVKGGAHPNPYVVLVSEFMLQQTTVKTVIPYFYRFMERFPTVFDLAHASIEDVYALWQGLGYYARARFLHTTAQMIVNDFKGEFPREKNEVLKLKGMGSYTVASFLALAFNEPETVVDGNVLRIIARLYHLTEPLSNIDDDIRARAQKLLSKEHPADYTSAIMDLGATVCTPKKPQCLLCPWKDFCKSKDDKNLEQIPMRKKIEKTEYNGSVYLIYNSLGEVLIRKRTESGLLSGLYEFPWCDNGKMFACAKNTGKKVMHIFTHIKLSLTIYTFTTENSPVDDGFFVAPPKLNEYAFSTLMKKVWKNRA